jgi:hypothetical protein
MSNTSGATWKTSIKTFSNWGGKVEGALRNVVQALREHSPQLSRQAITGDDIIEEEENRGGENCLKLLALHQPVAGDLRHVFPLSVSLVEGNIVRRHSERLTDRDLSTMPANGRPFRDLTDQRFVRLVAVSCLGIIEGHRVWLCDCDCGRRGVRVRQEKLLRRGKNLSCGCVKRTHRRNN